WAPWIQFDANNSLDSGRGALIELYKGMKQSRLFDYELKMIRAYGVLGPDQKWTGMVGSALRNKKKKIFSYNFPRPQWPSGKNSRYRGRWVPGSKPASTEDPPCMHVKSYVGVKRPPAVVVLKFGEGMPAQMFSSAPDCSSKLRVPPRIALVFLRKLDVNITKLN
ncbi:hypothetical protein AVEN_237686-1, partial [Araneus ventricosus]